VSTAGEIRRRPATSLTGVLAGLVLGLVPLTASADEIIVIEADTTTTDVTAGQAAMSLMPEGQGERSCTPEGREQAVSRYTETDRQIRYQLVNVDPELEARYDDLAPSEEDFEDKLEEACEDPESYQLTARIIYSTCRMTMRDGINMIDVRFPPGTGEGWLTLMDPATFQATEMPINFTQLMNQDTGVVQGQDQRNEPILSAGAPQDRTVRVNYETVTMTGREYRFDFNFRLNVMRSLIGVAGLGAAMSGEALPSAEGEGAGEELAEFDQLMQMFGAPNIHSSGTALITSDVPGLGIIRAFYQTFAAAMGAEGSYLSGLFNHELLEKGFPLELDQTTEMIMDSGIFGMMAGIPGVGGQGSESTMKVTGIIGPLSTDYEYCDHSIVPPEYTVTNPMSGQPSGDAGSTATAATNAAPGAAAGAEAMPDMTEAMNALNQAINSMTPEERAAMEQFGSGLGGLLGGAGAMPGMPGAGSPAAATPSPAPAGSGPSSSDLMTDDLTQSVQNLLQALGYDPGNTDGEATMQTAIAISQFQAEKGLEVTGEVSPQLAGILSAEVDR
jgi:hypothetical protein